MSGALLVSNLLLWIFVLVMGGVIFALVRQVGVLYERVAPGGRARRRQRAQGRRSCAAIAH